MNECQTQGGAAFTVEAEVIHHAVHPDLISPIEEEGETHVLKQDGSSSDMERFLYDNKEFCSQAPLTFEREYLLDGNLMQNHCLDHSKGNGSYIQNTNQFHISTEKGSLNLTDLSHNTASTPEIEQNFTPAGRNGIGETVNGARATPHSHGQATESTEGCVSLSTESSVSGRCQRGNVTTYSEQRNTAPYTHCVPAGPQPTVEELGRLFAHGCHTAEQNPLHGPSAQETSLGNRDRAPAGEKEPDLVIEVGGQKISAHKSVLAEQSDYFKARLSRDVLKVKGLNFQTLTVLIDYVYTSRMSVHKDNVVDVITGAKVLQIPCAVQAAMDSMSEQITTGNCYEILTIAKKQRLSELKETAYRFMSDNFLQILRDPAVYGRLTGSERDLILKKRTEGKKSLMIAEINDVFDRVGSRPASRCNSRPQSPLSVSSLEENHMIYYFNDTENDWRPLTVMPEDINTKGCGICTMYNYLFVAGGIKGYGDKGKVSDKVFCYNPVTNSWSEVRPLIQARSQLKLVSMDGNLYAIGGECLFTVEKYDPRMDRWTTVAPLPKGAFAVAHEAISCNGELYVSGGSLFYRLLKYDPKRDEWQESPYNNSRKRSTDMVAFKSFLYRFDVNRDQGINVFKYNTIVKMWHDCASQRLGSSFPFRCAVIGNCIYCVNKTQTLQFIVEEENCYFVEEPLRAPLEAKGILFPFILSLPEKPEKIA